jgi:type I restriction enzyme, S subunit
METVNPLASGLGAGKVERIVERFKYDIHLPPLDEQRQIVSVLSAIDREIVLLDRQQKAIAEQKKGLMQKLLTGQVRFKPSNGGD